MLSNILSVSSASKAGRALATAYMNKGNTLWSLHRHQEAATAYRRFIETASVVSLEYVAERSRDVAAVHNRIGVCQMQNGDFEGALLSFEAQRRYDMTSGLPDNNIACALLELHRNGEALTHAVSAVKANEKSSDAWDTLGLAHLRLNQLHKAEEALLKALTLDPQHRPALANLETVYNLMGLKDRAARCRRAMQ